MKSVELTTDIGTFQRLNKLANSMGFEGTITRISPDSKIITYSFPDEVEITLTKCSQFNQ